MSVGQAVESCHAGLPYPFLAGDWAPQIPQAIAAGWNFPRHPKLRAVQTRARQLRELLESIPRVEITWIVATPARVAQQEVEGQEGLEAVEALLGLLTGRVFERIARDVRRWIPADAGAFQRIVDTTTKALREDRESLLFILNRPPAEEEWLPESAPIGSFATDEDAQPIEPP